MAGIERIENTVVLQGRCNNQAWFAPRLAVVPGGCRPSGAPQVHVSVIQLTANDFGPMHYIRTADMGETWRPPMESMNLTGIAHPDDVFEKPQVGVNYHRASNTMLGLGGTAFTRDLECDGYRKLEGVIHDRVGDLAYAAWDDERGDFRSWQRLAAPRVGDDVCMVCFYCSQWHEEADGRMLVPICTPEGQKPSKVAVCEMFYDGETLTIGEVGRGLLGQDKMSGVHEPSLIEFGGMYYMTLRSEYGDGRMYWAASDDGLSWGEMAPWCWDDGAEVETENTQQHWLKQGDTLYLVYTRKNEWSNGVLRHRAPLFIAQVDAKTCRLIRETEQVVFPERGARMGNFTVAQVTNDEAWVMTGEWLQQLVPGYQKGMRFWTGETPTYNRIQYIGDLLLARIHFS